MVPLHPSRLSSLKLEINKFERIEALSKLRAGLHSQTTSGFEIIRRLRSYMKIDRRAFVALNVAKRTRDPFDLLVATILSQNTNDRNAIRAFHQLSASIGVSAAMIARAPLKEVKEAIEPAGMFNVRARALKDLAWVVLHRYGGDLGWIRRLPLEESRRRLLDLPHVGPKTADVLLLFLAGRKTFPIDTHVGRVSRHLEIIREKDRYEAARRKLMIFFPPSRYLEAHLLLIGHGRRTCKARRPLCGMCVLKDLCPFPKRHPAFLKLE